MDGSRTENEALPSSISDVRKYAHEVSETTSVGYMAGEKLISSATLKVETAADENSLARIAVEITDMKGNLAHSHPLKHCITADFNKQCGCIRNGVEVTLHLALFTEEEDLWMRALYLYKELLSTKARLLSTDGTSGAPA